MKDYVQRMIDERHELHEKLRKLNSFMLTGEFLELSDANQILLKKQADAMGDYLDILTCRIELNMNDNREV